MVRHLAARCLLVFGCWSHAWAADAVPFLREGRLGVTVSAVKFPDSLAKDLKSGLTNRLLVRVSLLSSSQLLKQRGIDIAVKYDLWEETFQLTMHLDGIAVQSNTYLNVQEVLAFLGGLRLPDLFLANDITGRQSTSIRVEMLANPIDRERMDKIRKWVVDNSAYVPPNVAEFGAGMATPPSRPSALFNKIFEQYSADRSLAANWRETVSSKVFKLEDLSDAK